MDHLQLHDQASAVYGGFPHGGTPISAGGNGMAAAQYDVPYWCAGGLIPVVVPPGGVLVGTQETGVKNINLAPPRTRERELRDESLRIQDLLVSSFSQELTREESEEILDHAFRTKGPEVHDLLKFIADFNGRTQSRPGRGEEQHATSENAADNDVLGSEGVHRNQGRGQRSDHAGTSDSAAASSSGLAAEPEQGLVASASVARNGLMLGSLDHDDHVTDYEREVRRCFSDLNSLICLNCCPSDAVQRRKSFSRFSTVTVAGIFPQTQEVSLISLLSSTGGESGRQRERWGILGRGLWCARSSPSLPEGNALFARDRRQIAEQGLDTRARLAGAGVFRKFVAWFAGHQPMQRTSGVRSCGARRRTFFGYRPAVILDEKHSDCISYRFLWRKYHTTSWRLFMDSSRCGRILKKLFQCYATRTRPRSSHWVLVDGIWVRQKKSFCVEEAIVMEVGGGSKYAQVDNHPNLHKDLQNPDKVAEFGIPTASDPQEEWPPPSSIKNRKRRGRRRC